jgi:hypothetical protein
MNDMTVYAKGAACSSAVRLHHGGRAYPGKAPRLRPDRSSRTSFLVILGGFGLMPRWRDLRRGGDRKIVAWVNSSYFSSTAGRQPGYGRSISPHRSFLTPHHGSALTRLDKVLPVASGVPLPGGQECAFSGTGAGGGSPLTPRRCNSTIPSPPLDLDLSLAAAWGAPSRAPGIGAPRRLATPAAGGLTVAASSSPSSGCPGARHDIAERRAKHARRRPPDLR